MSVEPSDDAKIVWSDSYLQSLSARQSARPQPGGMRRYTTESERKAARREDEAKHYELAAESVGCSGIALRRWHADYTTGRLRNPTARGRAIDMEKYKEAFKETLRWAENLAAVAKVTGQSLTWLNIGVEAMQDPAFRDEMKRQSDLHDAQVEAEKQRVARDAQRLMLSFSDPAGLKAKVSTDPKALLEGIGMAEEEPEDPALMRATWRLKRVLTRLGFECEDLAREALAAITRKVDWNAKSYYDFLTNPEEHFRQSVVYDGRTLFYKGEGSKKGIVYQGESELNEICSYRRFGLVDMLMLYWLEIPSATIAQDPDYWQRAADDENIWFVRGKYSFACRKLRYSQLVWLAQKAEENLKQEDVPKAAEHGCQEDGGDRLGTMNFDRFKAWWFDPVVELLRAVKRCKTEPEIKAWFEDRRKAQNKELSEDDLKDIIELVPILGRLGILVMDGASYHKVQNPLWAPLGGTDSLYGAGEVGRTDGKRGWGKERCVRWLARHVFGEERAKFTVISDKDTKSKKKKDKYLECVDPAVQQHVTALMLEDVLELKRRVELNSSRYRYTLPAQAVELAKLGFKWTPPQIGKFLNVSEIEWPIVKTGARKLPKEARENDDAIIAALNAEMAKLCARPRVLTNICLPSMRFCYSVLKAVFHGEAVVYKSKQVLFVELFKALNDFGIDLGKGEANDNSDNGAVHEPIDIEEPPSLAKAMFPMRVEDRFKAIENMKDEKQLEDEKAEHQQHLQKVLVDRPKRRRTLDTYMNKTLGDLQCGDWVYYTSQSTGRVWNAYFLRHNADGTLDLDCKKRAMPHNIERPTVTTPAKAEAAIALRKLEVREAQKAERKAKKESGKAFKEHVGASAPSINEGGKLQLEFAGAPVLGWEWDPTCAQWEVTLQRDEVVIRLVDPEDWPYDDPPEAEAARSDEGTEGEDQDEPGDFQDFFD